MKYVLYIITSMTMVRNSGVMSGKYNLLGICNSAKYRVFAE
jgi:hypothetical protein